MLSDSVRPSVQNRVSENPLQLVWVGGLFLHKTQIVGIDGVCNMIFSSNTEGKLPLGRGLEQMLWAHVSFKWCTGPVNRHQFHTLQGQSLGSPLLQPMQISSVRQIGRGRRFKGIVMLVCGLQ